MTRLFFALVLVAITIAQATFLPAINVLGIAPNLALVLILVWSALWGIPEGLLWAFPLGILLDLLSLDPIGTNGLALVPVAIIGGLARQRFFHSGLIVPMVLVVAATLGHQLVSSIVGAAVGYGFSLGAILRLGIMTALLNMMVVPILYFVVLILERAGVGRAART